MWIVKICAQIRSKTRTCVFLNMRTWFFNLLQLSGTVEPTHVTPLKFSGSGDAWQRWVMRTPLKWVLVLRWFGLRVCLFFEIVSCVRICAQFCDGSMSYDACCSSSSLSRGHQTCLLRGFLPFRFLNFLLFALGFVVTRDRVCTGLSDFKFTEAID